MKNENVRCPIGIIFTIIKNLIRVIFFEAQIVNIDFLSLIILLAISVFYNITVFRQYKNNLQHFNPTRQTSLETSPFPTGRASNSIPSPSGLANFA